MNRLNIFLLMLVMGCALSVVYVTNLQRHVFIELQRAQSQERQLQMDYVQLQYQQSSLSRTSRIEQIASDSLKMKPITATRTQYLALSPGAEGPDDERMTLVPAPASASVPASAPASSVPALPAGRRGGSR